MLSENGIAKLLGFKVHNAGSNEIMTDSQVTQRTSTCHRCGQEISAYWMDDEDRLIGWSAWKAKAECGE
jgi:hypothetical protein